VAEAAPGAEVLFLRITDEEAARLGLRGSPSVLIDGVDIAPVEMEGFG
jgi:acylphosphatase